jgi:hypothetical protein
MPSSLPLILVVVIIIIAVLKAGARSLVQQEPPQRLGILVVVVDERYQPALFADLLQHPTGGRTHREETRPFGPDLERLFLQR